MRYNNAEVMQANAGMMSDFADLHDQVKVLGVHGHTQHQEEPSATDGVAQPERQRTVQFTDLKQERQLRAQRATWALKSSDYKEKAEDIDGREGDAAADATKVEEGESNPGQTSKADEGGEKKKKTKKKKNKKKKGQDEGPSADNATLHSQAA